MTATRARVGLLVHRVVLPGRAACGKYLFNPFATTAATSCPICTLTPPA